ncbi:MDR family MFS transporter [Vibrio panuliri]|uniref:MFS transporter n=1 Tax=Vibrio panuliri TaxID=1381081 RepID=A0ABX3F6B2_9VIBR|nr:MFS transporter [Vibrio panuliri]KAB1457792.1 MFS transporter [Vibrio panuliri]OLQ85725.1 MFS transporter [Vibrio panuliri]
METDQTLFQWQRVKRFSLPIWTVLVGVLVTRTAYFMAWPFLIVFLYQDYGVSAADVGGMLAISALVASFTGLYSGYLSDKLGRKVVMAVGSCLAAFAFTGIGLASELWQFYLMVVLAGLMRPMIEAPSKAVISDNLADLKDRELALNIRYFVINLGGAIGPLLGITLALETPQLLFVATGATFVIYLLLILVGIERNGSFRKPDSSTLPNFRATMKVVAQDKVFLLLLIANFLMMFIYAQLESSLPQVIVRANPELAAKIIASLVLVNTLTIVIFQFPMLKWLEKVPLFTRTRIGMALMAIAQIGFMLTPVDYPIGWAVACFIISLGEVIAFPTLNVQIDRLAPPHLRGSYFGAAALYSLGFALGPWLGGLMIDKFNSNWLFLLCFALGLMMIWLYQRADRSQDSINRDEIRV